MKAARSLIGPLIALLLVAAFLPTAEATTYHYVATGKGLGCHGEVLAADPVCLGRIAFAVEPLAYLELVPQDVVWGDQVGYAVCFQDDAGECSASTYGCGPSTTVAPIDAKRVVISFWPVLVDAELGVCGATTGTLTL